MFVWRALLKLTSMSFGISLLVFGCPCFLAQCVPGFYIFCVCSETRPFSKEPWFLLVMNNINNLLTNTFVYKILPKLLDLKLFWRRLWSFSCLSYVCQIAVQKSGYNKIPSCWYLRMSISLHSHWHWPFYVSVLWMFVSLLVLMHLYGCL